MYITTENAAEYVGMTLHGKSNFHYWPLKVVENYGMFFVVDANGVMMPVPEPGDRFNSISFQEAVETEDEEEEEEED